MKRVGVLALQGDFEAHASGAGARRAPSRSTCARRAELERLDGLVIPGGESTTMLKLLRCGRAVRAAGGVRPAQARLRHLRRRHPAGQRGDQPGAGEPRADGHRRWSATPTARQLDSRVARVEPAPEFARARRPGQLEAVFIRAPIIRRVGRRRRVLARYDGDPVLVEEGRHLAATFHPELTADPRVHRLFLEKL